jgi:hypothetical protein
MRMHILYVCAKTKTILTSLNGPAEKDDVNWDNTVKTALGDQDVACRQMEGL